MKTAVLDLLQSVGDSKMSNKKSTQTNSLPEHIGQLFYNSKIKVNKLRFIPFAMLFMSQ